MKGGKKMNKTLLISIIVIVIVIIAIIIAVLVMKYPMTANPTPSNPNPQPAQGGAQTHSVTISGFAFSPASLTIHVGDIVVWTNKDSAAHTVTSDSGTELSSSSISNEGTYSHKFTSAGTYSYHCTVHPSMHGIVTVV
jgi:plastocyanin